MRIQWFFACLILLGCVVHRSSADSDEPGKITYEAQLLDKMIRMEMKMEQVASEVNKTRANVHSVLNNYTRILDDKTAELHLLSEKVDMPMVAFSVHNPVDTSPDTNQIIIWQSSRLNEGNAYDNVIGIFTAPVTGLYYFAVHICNYSTKVMQYAIVNNHTSIAQSYKYDNKNNDCGSINTVTMVTAGERVWVKCMSGSSSTLLWESSGRSSFIGVLMQT